MKNIKKVEDIINTTYIKHGSLIYVAGNAAVPQVLMKQLIKDPYIYDIELLSVLMLGDIQELFTKEVCQRIKHRIIFLHFFLISLS